MGEAATGEPILVVNAGSSSVKCGLYATAGERPVRVAGVHCDLQDNRMWITTLIAGSERNEDLACPVVVTPRVLEDPASLVPIRDGVSIAATMGCTPLDGLVMATRCGSNGSGAVLHLVLRVGLSAAAVETMLTRESGLLGVSGISGDMRVLLEPPDPRAEGAVEPFCERAARETSSLAAAIGGLDAVVFRAGTGEHAPATRERICAKIR